MAKIIEAQARITAVDATGAVFDKIAKKIEAIAKSAKTSKGVDALTKSLERAQQQMAAIDRFGSAKDGFAAARTRFREAQAAVDSAARAMRAGVGNAAALQRAYDGAQQAVSRASAAFEKQKSAVLNAKHSLEQLGVPAARAAAAQERLREAVDRTNAALERQPSKFRRAIGAAGRAAGNGMMLAGPGILHMTKEAAKSGAEIQSEIVRMRAAGIPESDIRRASSESGDLTAKYTNVKRADALERFKELRSIMLNPEEAHEMLPLAVQATSALNAIDRTGESAKGLNLGFRAADILGLGQDKGRMHDFIDSFIKAKQVMGDTITPEGIYELAKYSRASGATLSDRFRMTTGYSLAQEMGGSSAGKMTDQFVKQLTGGFQGNNHSAAKEFVAMGLAAKDDFDTTKTGEIKGMKPGHKLPGWRVAQSDPDKYVYDYLLPALEKHNITDPNEQIAQIRRMFPAGNAADLVTKLVQQRQSFANHAKLYGQAQGLDATETNKQDPFVGLNSLSTSLTNFAGVLTSPVMQDAASAMSGLSSWIGSLANEFSKFNEKHPDAAKILGGGGLAAGAAGGIYGTYALVANLFSGFGLGASATALDGSASLLSAAARELMGAGAVSGAKGAASGLPAAAGAAGGSIWGKIATSVPYVAAGTVAAAAIWDMHRNVVDNNFQGMSLNDRLRATGGHPTLLGAYRRAFRNEMGAPDLPPTMTYGTGLGGDKSVAVSGTVTGEGKMQVEVNAGSSLLDVVKRSEAAIQLAGRVSSGGPGSLGLSSPDATAPAATSAPQAPISY